MPKLIINFFLVGLLFLVSIACRAQSDISTQDLPLASPPSIQNGDLVIITRNNQTYSSTWPAATFPLASTTSAGAIFALGSPINSEWVSYIDTSGVQHLSQPAFGDIAGVATPAQLPLPTVSTIGGVKSLASASHQFLTGLLTSGDFTGAQPSFSDISGTASLGQLPTISFSNLAGNIAISQMNSGLGATATTYWDGSNHWSVPPAGTLPTLNPNQVLGSLTTATPSGINFPSCVGSASAIGWTPGTGPFCNSITGGNNNPGVITGLVFNNSSAASSNTSIINTALAAGGQVEIYCPAGTPVLYVNASLVIGSNTHFKLHGCTPTRANGTNQPMLVNYAFTQPWTYLNQGTANITGAAGQITATLHWANHPLSTGSWVQVGFAGDNPNWAISTSYDVGIKAIANGNIYQVSTAGVSASSGSGPSGTGGSISDGTVVWAYVSAFGGTSGYYWSGSQSATTQGGPADSAYDGVFWVVNIIDANNVTILLRRPPATTFSGIPIIVKQADHDLSIDGGFSVFDCNGANNTGSLTANAVPQLMIGIARAHFQDYSFLNWAKWAVGIEGAEAIDFDHVDGNPLSTYTGANQNQFLTYGCTDCTIGFVRGWGRDDGIAWSTSTQGTAHPDEILWSGGDVIGGHVHDVDNVSSFNALAIWPLHVFFYMDDLTLDHVHSHGGTGNQTVAGAEPIVRLDTGVYNPIAGTAQIGTIKLSDIDDRDQAWFFMNVQGTFGSMEVKNLILDNVTRLPNASGNMIQMQPGSGYTWTFDNITIQNSNLPAFDLVDVVNNLGTTVLGTINVKNNYLAISHALDISTTTFPVTIGMLNIEDNTIVNSGAFYLAPFATHININNNNISGTTIGVRVAATGSTISYCGNSITGMTTGLVQFTAAVGATVNSCGNNSLTGSSAWFNFSSAGTPTVHGWDIQGDVTKAARVTGSYMYNTNTSPGSGTLNTAGPVMDQGTTSGSWFAMFNPTGQTY